MKEIKNNLSVAMQQRFDAWKIKSEPTKMAKTAMGNYIQYRDFGDDISDYEKKNK